MKNSQNIFVNKKSQLNVPTNPPKNILKLALYFSTLSLTISGINWPLTNATWRSYSIIGNFRNSSCRSINCGFIPSFAPTLVQNIYGSKSVII